MNTYLTNPVHRDAISRREHEVATFTTERALRTMNAGSNQAAQRTESDSAQPARRRWSWSRLVPAWRL